jgi:hypothetical protein
MGGRGGGAGVAPSFIEKPNSVDAKDAKANGVDAKDAKKKRKGAKEIQAKTDEDSPSRSVLNRAGTMRDSWAKQSG